MNEGRNLAPPTSFWFGKALVQVKNYFLHKVLNVAVLGSADKHHPVVREALGGGFLPDLGTVTELQPHLDSSLRAGETGNRHKNRLERNGTDRRTHPENNKNAS